MDGRDIDEIKRKIDKTNCIETEQSYYSFRLNNFYNQQLKL